MIKFWLIIKKFKILILVFFLVLLSGLLVYGDYKSNMINENLNSLETVDPYILLTRGNGLIKRDSIIRLKEQKKEGIKIGDKIRTMESSNATIFWPDGSVTRLGEKTAITINEMKVSKDLSTIQLKFNLEEGKTWSNIIRLLTGESYFTETNEYGNYAATVRGTVFEMNADDKFVKAHDHNVMIEDFSKKLKYEIPEGIGYMTDGTYEIFEIGTPLDVSDSGTIDTSSETRTDEWEAINKKEDSEYLIKLDKDLRDKIKKILEDEDIFSKAVSYVKTYILKDSNNIASEFQKSFLTQNESIKEEFSGLINSLDNEEIDSLNKDMRLLYQKVHALPYSEELGKKKMQLRNVIINTAEESNYDETLEKFTKLEIFDYIEAKSKGHENLASQLKISVNGYLKEIGDAEKIMNVLSTFSEDIYKTFTSDLKEMSKELDFIKSRLKKPEVRKKVYDSSIDKASELINDAGGAVKGVMEDMIRDANLIDNK